MRKTSENQCFVYASGQKHSKYNGFCMPWLRIIVNTVASACKPSKYVFKTVVFGS